MCSLVHEYTHLFCDVFIWQKMKQGIYYFLFNRAFSIWMFLMIRRNFAFSDKYFSFGKSSSSKITFGPLKYLIIKIYIMR
jgi:hypothetical protein